MMPGGKQQNRYSHGSAGFDARRLLVEWGEKAFAVIGKNVFRASERECAPSGPTLSQCIDIGHLVKLQAHQAHKALINNFGLQLGLAAPQVIILALYPQGLLAAPEVLRATFDTLIRMNAGYSPDEIKRMLEGRIWTVDGGDFVPLTKGGALDLRQMLQEKDNFRQKAPVVFDVPPSLSGTTGIDAPVLVAMGLFPELQPADWNYSPGDTLNKPFTRHDESMSIFSFAEEMLLACGQGVASVVAPAALCRVPEAVGVRKRWIKEFDRVCVDAMADSALYQLVKLPPDRTPRYRRGEGAAVLYRMDGTALYRSAPTASASAKNVDEHYRSASPVALNKYSLIPLRISEEYHSWASIADIVGVEPISGIMEKRGGVLIDIDGEVLERRMRTYLDRNLPWRDYIELGEGLTTALRGFESEEARKSILQQIGYNPRNIKPYAFKPFDNRYCYYSPATPLWNDPRPELARQCRSGNQFLLTRPAAAIEPEGVPFFLADCLTDGDLLRGHAYCIPFCLYGDDNQPPSPNLSRAVLDYLRGLRLPGTHEPERLAQLIWLHVLAIGFSPTYLSANAEALQQGWPRIPFPAPLKINGQGGADAATLLLHSANLGEKIALLLKMKGDSLPLFDGENTHSWREIAPLFFWSAEKKDAEPFTVDSIALNAHWGYAKARSKDAVREASHNVMPGRGRLFRRSFSNKERRALEDLGLGMGLHAGAVYAALGHDTCDIYLDNDVFWRNVPSNVWEYRIGGYPVLKKWLSYREHSILGRNLRRDELHYFTEMVRRLTALRLLESELDRNFASIRDHSGDPTKTEK